MKLGPEDEEKKRQRVSSLSGVIIWHDKRHRPLGPHCLAPRLEDFVSHSGLRPLGATGKAYIMFDISKQTSRNLSMTNKGRGKRTSIRTEGNLNLPDDDEDFGGRWIFWIDATSA